MGRNGDSEGRIIQSVDRAVKALKLFLGQEKELGIKDFASLLDLPKPTIYSIVNTLTVHEILEQNPDNSKYRLGPVSFRLGLQYLRNKDLLSTMVVWIERLSYKFRKSVNVCMLIANQVVVVHKVDPEEAIISYPNIGAVVPIHTTANGKVLLAFCDDDVREKALATCTFDKHSEFAIGDLKTFEKELETVRKEKVGFNRGEGVVGIWAISGPIYNHNNQLIASFAISGTEEYFKENQDKLVAEVRKTSLAISKQLGYTGSPY